MTELRLTQDGDLAFARAQELCVATNLGIVTPEHLLTGALIVLAEEQGVPGLPPIEAMARARHLDAGGRRDATRQIRRGSVPPRAKRWNAAPPACARAEGPRLARSEIALGTIASGEVNPMFYGGLGLTKQELIDALGA